MAMTNITDVYWEANGVSLHTYAWSVETKAGRMASAPKRGEDYQVPFVDGRSRTKKYREARTLSLPMWVAPVNPDGSDDPTMSYEDKVEANWYYLMSIMDVSGDFPLVKRFRENGVLRTATGRAELLDPPDITVAAKNVWRFTLELQMADPWFYAPEISVAAGSVFEVEGNVETPHVTLEMSTGRMTFPGGNFIEYEGSGTVVIDCFQGSAKKSGNYVNGLISRHRKFAEWPTLSPGSNTVDGSGTIKYEPAYR